MKIDKTKIQNFIKNYKTQILIAIGGIILITLGFAFQNKLINLNGSKIEVVKNDNSPAPVISGKDVVVDVSGSVEKPGVYHLPPNSRIEDALIASGGLSANADRNWVDRNLNKAAKLIDGQKIFVPSNQQSNVLGATSGGSQTYVAQSYNGTESTLVNINTASLQELDSLPGIGQVYAQNIIDHRPYSDINELITNKVLKQSVYDKIKDKISVY